MRSRNRFRTQQERKQRNFWRIWSNRTERESAIVHWQLDRPQSARPKQIDKFCLINQKRRKTKRSNMHPERLRGILIRIACIQIYTENVVNEREKRTRND